MQTDINDKPPNPEQAPPPARLTAPTKPWERTNQITTTATPAEPPEQKSPGELYAPQSEVSATSIFEAAVSPRRESPAIIAGRLSPSSQRRPEERAPAVTVQLPDGPVDLTTPAQGSGLGRPSSRGWRPPPIPVRTLSHSREPVSGEDPTPQASHAWSADLGDDGAPI